MQYLRPISMVGAVVGVQALAVGAAFLLQVRDRMLRSWLPYLVSLAVGVLLGTALLHLMPEAISALGNRAEVWGCLGVTMVVLFAVERIFYAATGVRAEQPDPQRLLHEHEMVEHGHRHGAGCGNGSDEHSGRVTQPLSLVMGSMLHSFVDGVTISTAFAANERIGWLTAFAVALHEIPHRIGDLAVFLHLRVPRARALRYAILEGVPALVASVAVLAVGFARSDAVQWLLPISAGSFLYIAMVSLMPELQIECRMPRVLGQIGCLIAGVLLVGAITGLTAS